MFFVGCAKQSRSGQHQHYENYIYYNAIYFLYSSESLLQSIYNISYVWVSMYALLGGVIVGSVVSFFTSGT